MRFSDKSWKIQRAKIYQTLAFQWGRAIFEHVLKQWILMKKLTVVSVCTVSRVHVIATWRQLFTGMSGTRHGENAATRFFSWMLYRIYAMDGSSGHCTKSFQVSTICILNRFPSAMRAHFQQCIVGVGITRSRVSLCPML